MASILSRPQWVKAMLYKSYIYPLQWRPMSIMVPKIAGQLTFYLIAFSGYQQRTSQSSTLPASQMTSNMESVSMSWLRHARITLCID